MAKGAIITEKVFASILILHEANPELNNKQISAVFKVDESTVGKMIRCGTWENYEAFKKEKAEKQKEREKKRKAEQEKVVLVYDPSIAEEYKREQEAKQAEEQLPGQMEMDLVPAEEPDDHDETLGDMQKKMMRFQAAQVDKLIVKIDRLNDTLSMILRAVRKE